jgi:putative aminopeptidase FrvX
VDPLELLQQFVSIPGPPGQERLVRECLIQHVNQHGLKHETDAKGNLLVRVGKADKQPIVITAHMDEIAMIVRRIDKDGRLTVGPLGGLFPWKLGESPVHILASGGDIQGVLSFGSIHTADPSSTVRKAEQEGLAWEMAEVITGLTHQELVKKGVRPGTRVVISPDRRKLIKLGDLVSGYFLDDRADLVAWLLALKELKDTDISVLFAATAAEEVGGEGAKFILQSLRPTVCIALELGPAAPDAPVELTDQPTVWTTDSYSTMSAEDGDLVARVGSELGMKLQFQSLSRGGSDASASANQGLCARPITLGLAMENSHGFEIMHPGSMANLAKLTVGLVRALTA